MIVRRVRRKKRGRQGRGEKEGKGREGKGRLKGDNCRLLREGEGRVN